MGCNPMQCNTVSSRQFVNFLLLIALVHIVSHLTKHKMGDFSRYLATFSSKIVTDFNQRKNHAVLGLLIPDILLMKVKADRPPKELKSNHYYKKWINILLKDPSSFSILRLLRTLNTYINAPGDTETTPYLHSFYQPRTTCS